MLQGMVPAVSVHDPRACRTAQRFDVTVVEIADGLCEQAAGGARRRHADLFIDQFGDGGSTHSHYRPAAGHGFEHDQTEGLGGARMHQRIGRGQQLRKFGTIAAIRKHGDIGRGCLYSPPPISIR